MMGNTRPRDWFEREAELIIDGFVRDDDRDGDLLRLEQAITAALRRAFNRGKRQKTPLS